jgi:phage terminase large subunit-like protein
LNVSLSDKERISGLSVKDVTKAELLGSFLLFARVFFKLKTGREFVISQPPGREPHVITIARELKAVFNMQTTRLLINVPPGYHKSTLLVYWVAWCYANYPDCNFLYISVGYDLAVKHTATIKEIIEMPEYKRLFGVYLQQDSRSKGNFKTEAGGICTAFGAGMTIVGADAGLPNLDRFSGCVIMDDMHKAMDTHSDTLRGAVIDNYKGTITMRPRSHNVARIFIGQRLHEDDLPAYLIDGREGYEWKKVILSGLDGSDNPLYPEAFPKEMLIKMRETDPYNFWAQQMQQPQPAGGGIFRRDWFVLTDIDPPIVTTFLTIDTAESNENWSDYTAMSFWGIYKIEIRGIDTGVYGLHWIDARQIKIEPKDLEAEFYDFYMSCMRYKIKPDKVLIEKKSAGTTLVSILRTVQGMHAIPIERNAGGGSKTARFFECQKFVASGRITIPRNGKHTEMCLEHMRKITGNQSHAHDDLCFVAGTKIATPFGYKAIESMKPGDLVITPLGIDKVLNAKMTNPQASVITSIGLTGTRKHPVFTDAGFAPLDTLKMGDKISHLSLRELLKWKYQKLLFSMGSNTGSWGRENIISVKAVPMKEERVLKDFMSRFGNFIAGKQYLKAMLFTIRMATILIMTSVIWNAFLMSNIWKSIVSRRSLMENQSAAEQISSERKKRQWSGILAQKEENGIASMLPIAFSSLRAMFARFVERSMKKLHPQEAFSAPIFAGIEINTEDSQSLELNVGIAEQTLRQKNSPWHLRQENTVHEHAQLEPVYNLTIKNHGMYYANDILVSNCDSLEMAVRACFIDESLLPYTNKESTILNRLSGEVNKLAQLRQRAS